jgi:protein-tyrosine phosphatase
VTKTVRKVDFAGTQNLRDLGGIPTVVGATRFGAIYRSDRLSNLSAADHVKIGDLGISTVIDMRIAEERVKAPNRLPVDGSVRQIVREFMPRRTARLLQGVNSGEFSAETTFHQMLEQYKSMALEHMGDYRGVIDDLLEHRHSPSVFHCTSGKDRTGMVAAILLLAIEASEEAIVADYVMTEGNIEKLDIFAASADPRAVDVVMSAKPDYICAAMGAMIDNFGSTAAYLREGIGLNEKKHELLRTLLVD